MPVAIHTMGKVGSVSITQMLQTVYGVKAHHLHYGFWPEGEYSAGAQLKLGAKIHRLDDRWRIITLVRKPLWRNLSAFFHALRRYYGKDYYDFESLRGSFIFNYNHQNPQDWFDYDWYPMYQWSLLDEPFNTEDGWQIYNPRPGLSVLVLRTEDLSAVAPQAFKAFMDLDDVSVDIVNFTRTPWYARMRKELHVPSSLIEYVNALPYAQHFYTPEELEEDFRCATTDEDPWENIDRRPVKRS